MESHILVDRIVDRIHGLGAKKLSYGGRIVLINAVLNTLHNYWARIFILPNKTIKEINDTCRNFLWHGHEHYNNSPPIAWNTICQPKKNGGLGITSALEWNIAALGKYVWWIAQKKDTLWVKWVNATYLKGRDWKEYRPPPNSSWVWRKICMVKDKLKLGYKGQWWLLTDGQYTVKEGYKWLKQFNPPVPWADFVWNRVSSPKHAFCAWMIAHQRLKTKDRLPYLNLPDLDCFFCSMQKETHQHLFFECPISTRALQQTTLWLNINLSPVNVAHWWQCLRIKSLLQKKYIAATIICLMYHLWQARNNARIKLSIPLPNVIVQKVRDNIQALLKQDARIRVDKHKIWSNRLLE